MESPNPHNSRKRAIDELVHGRDLAISLQLSLKKSSSFGHQDLVTKIMGSFSDTLAILDSCVVGKYEDYSTSESCKPLSLSPTFKERRGCYKRRKTSETWSKESTNLIDDGHAWRKYGQKVILHAHHPRNYFRCTHKFDKKCQATKQVQMIQENPPLFRTTYNGHHICKNLHKAPQIILDNSTTSDCSILLSFDQSTNQDKNINHDNLIAVYPLTNQEVKEEVHQSLFQNQTDYVFAPDDLTADPINSALSSGSDQGETISSGVYSCSTTTTSTHNNWGMDHNMMVGSDFDDVFQFEF